MDEPPRRRRRGLIVAAGILAGLAILAGGETLFWHVASDRLRQGFATWIALRRAAGWTVTAGAETVTGWPFAAALDVAGLSLSATPPTAALPIAWTTDRLRLDVALLHPGTLTLTPGGQQRLTLGTLPPFTADAADLHVRLPLTTDPVPPRIEAEAMSLRVDLPDMAGPLSVERIDLAATLDPAAVVAVPALGLVLHAAGIALPPPGPAPGTPWPLGPRIASLMLQAALSGPVPAAPPAAGTHALTAIAAAWREGGGSLAVNELRASWGPLALGAGATLSLDPRLQPIGAATVRLGNYPAALDALVANGAMSSRTATAVRAVLGLLGRATDAGDPGSVEVPLRLEDRALSLGQIPVAKLPPIAWP